MKSSLLVIYLVANCFALNAQSKTFKISGQFKKPINGIIFLISEGIQEDYYFKKRTRDSAEIVNGVFTITREIKNNFTYAFRFYIETGATSDLTGLVFIEPEDQTDRVYGLNWGQYLDKDRKEPRKFFVNQFPTNYLLNSSGQIIRKNVSPFELKCFLLRAFSMEKPIFDKMEGFEPYN